LLYSIMKIVIFHNWSMMRFIFLPGFWNIIVTGVMSMPCSFVFEVFFMVAYQVILMRSWLWFCNIACVFPQEIIVDLVILHAINVHVGNWWENLFRDFGSSGSSPVSLDCLHVPLVYHCYDVLLFYVVKITENSFASLIHHDSFLFWWDFIEHCH